MPSADPGAPVGLRARLPPAGRPSAELPLDPPEDDGGEAASTAALSPCEQEDIAPNAPSNQATVVGEANQKTSWWDSSRHLRRVYAHLRQHAVGEPSDRVGPTA
jgi:hypothetical protein